MELRPRSMTYVREKFKLKGPSFLTLHCPESECPIDSLRLTLGVRSFKTGSEIFPRLRVRSFKTESEIL